MKTIEITVDPKGQARVETKGFSGGECREVDQTEAAGGMLQGMGLASEFAPVLGPEQAAQGDDRAARLLFEEASQALEGAKKPCGVLNGAKTSASAAMTSGVRALPTSPASRMISPAGPSAIAKLMASSKLRPMQMSTSWR